MQPAQVRPPNFDMHLSILKARKVEFVPLKRVTKMQELRSDAAAPVDRKGAVALREQVMGQERNSQKASMVGMVKHGQAWA